MSITQRAVRDKEGYCMKVKELRDYLDELIEDGKGDYEAMGDGRGRSIEIELSDIDDRRREVWL